MSHQDNTACFDLRNSKQVNTEAVPISAIAEKRLYKAAALSQDTDRLSADLKNPDSWIRRYFQLLNEEIGTPSFPGVST